VAEIVPAEAAWAAGAAAFVLNAGHAGRTLVVCLDDRVVLLRVRADRTIAVRRLPVDAPDIVRLVLSRLEEMEEGGKESAPAVGVIGDTSFATELRAAVRAGGEPTRAFEDGRSSDTPALVAARFATRAAGPSLSPEAERLVLQQRTRRLTLARFAAAALLLVAAAGAQLWGSSREHNRIMAERERIRETVDRALVTRDSLTEAMARLTTLRSSASSATRWSALIASLASELPDDAFLASLRGDGDTLRLEGSAARATGALSAVARVRGLRSVRPEGPIRQEISDDGSTSERFTLSAVLDRTP
jgi:hypothetical protein